MSMHTFQDLLKSIQRKWSAFMEDEGHAAFPFNNPPSTPGESNESCEEDSEERKKFEEFIYYQNKEYEKIGCKEIPIIIQRLKVGDLSKIDKIVDFS